MKRISLMLCVVFFAFSASGQKLTHERALEWQKDGLKSVSVYGFKKLKTGERILDSIEVLEIYLEFVSEDSLAFIEKTEWEYPGYRQHMVYRYGYNSAGETISTGVFLERYLNFTSHPDTLFFGSGTENWTFTNYNDKQRSYSEERIIKFCVGAGDSISKSLTSKIITTEHRSQTNKIDSIRIYEKWRDRPEENWTEKKYYYDSRDSLKRVENYLKDGRLSSSTNYGLKQGLMMSRVDSNHLDWATLMAQSRNSKFYDRNPEFGRKFIHFEMPEVTYDTVGAYYAESRQYDELNRITKETCYFVDAYYRIPSVFTVEYFYENEMLIGYYVLFENEMSADGRYKSQIKDPLEFNLDYKPPAILEEDDDFSPVEIKKDYYLHVSPKYGWLDEEYHYEYLFEEN